MRPYTCDFKEIGFLFFENAYSGIVIDSKTVFSVLYFMCMPLINTRSIMKKTENPTFFLHF